MLTKASHGTKLDIDVSISIYRVTALVFEISKIGQEQPGDNATIHEYTSVQDWLLCFSVTYNLFSIYGM